MLLSQFSLSLSLLTAHSWTGRPALHSLHIAVWQAHCCCLSTTVSCQQVATRLKTGRTQIWSEPETDGDAHIALAANGQVGWIKEGRLWPELGWKQRAAAWLVPLLDKEGSGDKRAKLPNITQLLSGHWVFLCALVAAGVQREQHSSSFLLRGTSWGAFLNEEPSEEPSSCFRPLTAFCHLHSPTYSSRRRCAVFLFIYKRNIFLCNLLLLLLLTLSLICPSVSSKRACPCFRSV